MADERGRLKVPFDPHGEGYDFETAYRLGLQPEAGSVEWPYMDPHTRRILIGRKHPRWKEAEDLEYQIGNRLTLAPTGYFYAIPHGGGLRPRDYGLARAHRGLLNWLNEVPFSVLPNIESVPYTSGPMAGGLIGKTGPGASWMEQYWPDRSGKLRLDLGRYVMDAEDWRRKKAFYERMNRLD